ncbi:MAG: glutathione transferase [Nodosilinea sp.]
MSTAPLTLFVDSLFASPYALSAYVSLVEKGLTFDLETVDLSAEAHLQSEYRDRSLTARVPTLAHGDFYLSESTAIIEYLEEAFPKQSAVLPAALGDRARARQLQAWLRSDLLALRDERPTDIVFLGATGAPLSKVGQQAADKLVRVASDRLSSEGPNLFCEWCIADVDLALMLNRLVFNQDPVTPRLRNYATHQWQRPSVQQWLKLGQT